MDDLDGIYQILDVDLAHTELGTKEARARDERKQWLQWTIMSYEELDKLYQPPYGDRAMTLRHTGQLIGACGYVPCLAPFGQLPAFSPGTGGPAPRVNSTEFGLFYAVAPAYQRQGYATEAANALINYAFEHLGLSRMVAMTSYENLASIGVMHNLGMRIEKNRYPDPPWLQVVGIIETDQPVSERSQMQQVHRR